MSQKRNNQIMASKLWLSISVGVTLILIFAYLIIDDAYQDANADINKVGQLALGLVIASLAAIGASVFAIIKLKGWKKVVPGVGMALLCLVMAASYFMYWFSQYTSF